MPVLLAGILTRFPQAGSSQNVVELVVEQALPGFAKRIRRVVASRRHRRSTAKALRVHQKVLCSAVQTFDARVRRVASPGVVLEVVSDNRDLRPCIDVSQKRGEVVP